MGGRAAKSRKVALSQPGVERLTQFNPLLGATTVMKTLEAPKGLPLNTRVSFSIAMSGRIVGRSFAAKPRYDIETPDGIICGIPEEWIVVKPVIVAMREAS